MKKSEDVGDEFSLLDKEGKKMLAKALAAKAMAEARQADASAQKAEYELVAARIDSEKATQKRFEELASFKYQHIYYFDNAVSDSTVTDCMHQLNLWDQENVACPIEIIFYSPGGSVLAGLALFDYLRQLSAKGHHITTRALGMAASMAGILLQAGDTRTMGKEAYILIHEISAGAVGKIGEMEDEMIFLKKIQGRILDIFAERAKVTRAYFASHWRRKDWWIDSREALKLGIVDEVC